VTQSKKICTKAEGKSTTKAEAKSHDEGGGQVHDEGGGQSTTKAEASPTTTPQKYNVPLLRREASGSVNGFFKGIAL